MCSSDLFPSHDIYPGDPKNDPLPRGACGVYPVDVDAQVPEGDAQIVCSGLLHGREYTSCGGYLPHGRRHASTGRGHRVVEVYPLSGRVSNSLRKVSKSDTLRKKSIFGDT